LDDFDKGWLKDAKSGLALPMGQDKQGKDVASTFFNDD